MLRSTRPVLSMVLYLTLIFIFTSELSVNGCHLKITQPQELLFGNENQSISISCHINMSTCGNRAHEVLWYVFTSDSHHQLDTQQHSQKYELKNQHLQINDLTASDDGVYYCAATLNMNKSGAQAFGSGTIVKVKVHDHYTHKAVLLTLMVLLTLLSITVLTHIICIKTGRHTSFLKGRFRSSDMKVDSSKKVHFGAVVQELYSKRNLRKKNASSEVPQEIKFENPRSQAEKDDIYQNFR